VPNACHHISCVTFEGDDVVAFLGDVMGLPVADHMQVPGTAMTHLQAWPHANPGARAAMMGAGMKGLVEVVRAPEELRGMVSPGTALITFSVTDLEERLAAARRHGYRTSEIIEFPVNDKVKVAVATVLAGDLTFELVRFDVA
jgi:catechol 2,3-dioxygenase-like lactoylglutathione lyase family enzyme